MTEIKNLIFDYNGTIVNDVVIFHERTQKVFEKLGLPGMSFDEFKQKQELPMRNFWKNYTTLHIKEIEKIYQDIAREDQKIGKVHQGILEVLKHCKERGINVAILSGCEEGILKDELLQLEISEYFKEIKGSAPEKLEAIKEIIKNHNFIPEETVMIGDSGHDVLAGKKAGTKTIGLTYGYERDELISENEPDFKVNNPAELHFTLKRLLE